MPSVPAAQFPILVSILGSGDAILVLYSYIVIIDGQASTYTLVPECDLCIVEATYCTFLLDFESSKAGWIITGTTPLDDAAPLTATPGPYYLSVTTANPDQSGGGHNFYLNFYNTLTTETWQDDPQETNIPTMP